MNYKLIKKKKRYWRNALQILLLVAIAILLAIVLRVFFFASFKIPSPSMEPAIKPGDYILVNKTIPGARIFKDFDFLETGNRPNIYRCKGFGKIKRNDVLVFNYPYTDWNKLTLDVNTYYVKRCVALPGDTFYIENGIYKVKNCPDTLGCMDMQKRISYVDEKQVDRGVYYCFPHKKLFNWNIKNFGPLYVPQKGDGILIDKENIHLYRKLIEYETGELVNLKNDSVYLAEEQLNNYTFLQNYYFMTGDYVLDSRDSRYWGLLPEDHVVGKAFLIWKSKEMDTDTWRWNRMFKQIK